MIETMKKTTNFLLVGLVTFIVDYGILVILESKLGMYYLIANTISFTLAVITNYYLSISFVFGKENTKDNFITFIIISIIGLIISEILMGIGVEYLNIHYTIVKMFSTVIVMIYNFISKSMMLE